MFFTFCLISFGIYLGQEYPNLPLVKNVFLNLLTYAQKLPSPASNEQHHTTVPIQKELSFLRKVYNLCSSFTSYFSTSQSSTSEALYTTSNYKETDLQLDNSFSSIESHLKKRSVLE